MTSRRQVRAGQLVTLRALFQDDIGEDAQASGVEVHIFQPGHATDDLANAIIVSGEATYFDQGIHEYPYVVPHAGPNGIWKDLWFGTLNSQVLSGVFSFQVSASGEVQELGTQLHQNNIVEITIPSGITATDGSFLTEEQFFTFMTEIIPGYTNTRKVRLEGGGWFNEVEEDTIQQAILEASLEADVINFAKTKNKSVFQHARREWTTCRVGLLLLTNTNTQALKAKTLDDLHVEYDTQALRDIINRLQACVDRWEGQLIAGGKLSSSKQPQTFVKGAFDPDRPEVGRLWEDVQRFPASNTKTLTTGKRRYKNSFKNKKNWW